MPASNTNGPSAGLVLIRLAVALILLRAGWHKIVEGVGPELVESTRARADQAPQFYRWFMLHVVLAAPGFFAFLIQWGELLAGVSLFLGALVRPASIAAAFLFANFYFSGPPEQKTFVALLCVCCLAFAISRAGRRLGLDAIFDQHFPTWVTWSRKG